MPADIVRYGMISTARIGLNAHIPVALLALYASASSGQRTTVEQV
jgi:hypothetical protein